MSNVVVLQIHVIQTFILVLKAEGYIAIEKNDHNINIDK